MIKKLLVIIPDRLSVLIHKGEVIEEYYNPGSFFDEVHIMMTNDDKPDPKYVQSMVGNAKLFIYNHPEPRGFFKKTLGWQPFLINDWLKAASNKFSMIRPDIIRCYGAHLNLMIALFLKRMLNIPLLVSLHTHPYLDAHRESLVLKDKIIKYCGLRLANYLREADLVLPVYKGIVDFLNKLDVKRYKILYNQVGTNIHDYKKDYKFNKIFKLVCVGQQIQNKNPINLICAIAQLDNVMLDIIGVGILNQDLKNLVKELNIEDRVHFIDAIPHTRLCQLLKTYDAFAACIDCVGLSKTVIEAFLSKLPVLLNWNSHVQVPELNESICLRVQDSIQGYITGIKSLKENQMLREQMAERAYQHAIVYWDPEKIQKEHVEIYKSYLK